MHIVIIISVYYLITRSLAFMAIAKRRSLGDNDLGDPEGFLWIAIPMLGDWLQLIFWEEYFKNTDFVGVIMDSIYPVKDKDD